MSQESEEAANNGGNEFSLRRIYVKDISFESPGSPKVFTTEWKPQIQLELNNNSQKLEDDLYEVVLTLTVTAKNQDATAFIVEIKQAGIFMAKGFDKEKLPALLGSYCPSVLYPYAREAVSDLVGKGSFPQLLLAPVNFEALYAEAAKKQQSEAN